MAGPTRFACFRRIAVISSSRPRSVTACHSPGQSVQTNRLGRLVRDEPAKPCGADRGVPLRLSGARRARDLPPFRATGCASHRVTGRPGPVARDLAEAVAKLMEQRVDRPARFRITRISATRLGAKIAQPSGRHNLLWRGARFRSPTGGSGPSIPRQTGSLNTSPRIPTHRRISSSDRRACRTRNEFRAGGRSIRSQRRRLRPERLAESAVRRRRVEAAGPRLALVRALRERRAG
jgi:hypothetical protein